MRMISFISALHCILMTDHDHSSSCEERSKSASKLDIMLTP